MKPHQRAAIEALKQEKVIYVQLLAELQAQKHGMPAASAQQQQEGFKLQQLANTYRHKAQEEQQLLEQIEQELQKAKQQIEHQRKQHSTIGAAAQQGVSAAKCCVALQERLSHKKQQLDAAVSRNKALKGEVEDLSMRGTAAQQLHTKLQRQLADAASELAQLQELVHATEQAQQQAAALAEQLRLHNDAEGLAVNEAKRQLEAWTLNQQHPSMCGQQAALLEQSMRRSYSADGLTEEEATNILEQLMQVYDAAGLQTRCPASNAGEQADSSRWAALLQHVQQSQSCNVERFRQCSLANHQLRQLQQEKGSR